MIHLLTPFDYSEGTEWRFRLNADVTLHFSDEFFGYHRLYDQDGTLRVIYEGRTITVLAGYAWDGSSPKYRLLGNWIGTPDFEASRLGSLFHDTFYQFLHLPCFPFGRLKADALFGDIMRSQGFRIHFVYSGAVMVFGWIHRGVGTLLKKRKGNCGLHN